MISVRHLLRSQAVVYRNVPTADAGGGQSTVRTLQGTSPCRYRQPTVAVEGTSAGADVANVMDIVYFLPTADIQRNDELNIGATVLDVHAVYTPSEPIYLRADCRSRQK